MSMYNIVHGYDPTAGIVLKMLGLGVNREALGQFRFRDAWIADVDELAIYTRLGGANRQDYTAAIDALRQHWLYLRDVDDTFDNTFATFYFRPPEECRAAVAAFVKRFGKGLTGDERWARTFAALDKKK